MFYSFILTKPYVYLNHSQGWWGGGQAPAGGIIPTRTSGVACPGEEQLISKHGRLLITFLEKLLQRGSIAAYISEKHAVLLTEFGLPTSWCTFGDWSPGCPHRLEIPPWNSEMHIPHPQPWTHSNLPTAIKFLADFKIHLPVCDLAASYLNECMAPRHLTRVLRSQNLGCRHSLFV